MVPALIFLFLQVIYVTGQLYPHYHYERMMSPGYGVGLNPMGGGANLLRRMVTPGTNPATGETPTDTEKTPGLMNLMNRIINTPSDPAPQEELTNMAMVNQNPKPNYERHFYNYYPTQGRHAMMIAPMYLQRMNMMSDERMMRMMRNNMNVPDECAIDPKSTRDMSNWVL